VNGALSAREASIFACLTDTLLAPAPPLPPVHETDAVASFDAWLLRAPRANRVALRGLLLALEIAPWLLGARMRWRRLSPARRLALLQRLERIGGGRAVLDALRAAAAVSYYGDAHVAALLGYVPARGRAARP
jgi:hypothetical protein